MTKALLQYDADTHHNVLILSCLTGSRCLKQSNSHLTSQNIIDARSSVHRCVLV